MQCAELNDIPCLPVRTFYLTLIYAEFRYGARVNKNVGRCRQENSEMSLTSLLHACIPVRTGLFSTTLCSSCRTGGKHFARGVPGKPL